MIDKICAIGVLLIAMHMPAHGENKKILDTQERINLHAALRGHVDALSIGGIFPSMDLKHGKFVKLYPTTSHAEILKIDDVYVMCADFRDDKGSSINVDFYMLKKGKGYSIFQIEVGNRAPIEGLMKIGRAVLMN